MGVIVALGHRKRVGKDLSAQYLKTKFIELGYKRTRVMSFAAKLKETAYSLYYWAGVRTPAYYFNNPMDKEAPILRLGITYRQLLISMGMAMRDIHPDTWIGPIIDEADRQDVLIIPDLRFPNEFELVQEAKGLCVKITRASIQDTDDAADCALANWPQGTWDVTFKNDTLTVEDFIKDAERNLWSHIVKRL